MRKKLLLGTCALTLLINMVGAPWAGAMEIQEPGDEMSVEQSRMYHALIDTISETGDDDWATLYSDNVSLLAGITSSISVSEPAAEEDSSEISEVPESEFACLAKIQRTSTASATPVWAHIYLEQNDDAGILLDEAINNFIQSDMSERARQVNLEEIDLCGTTATRWELEILKYSRNNGDVEETWVEFGSYLMFAYDNWYCYISTINFTPGADELAGMFCENLGSMGDINRPPRASFTISPSSPLAGETVEFTSTSTDPEKEPLTCSWYFDGQFISDKSGCGIENIAKGEHEIKLKVTDSKGQTDEAARTIEVTDSLYSIKLIDKKEVLYDFDENYPVVTLELKGDDWEKHRAKIGSIKMTFELRLTGTNDLGTFQWPEKETASCQVPLYAIISYIDGGLMGNCDGDTMTLDIPLFRILRNDEWLKLYEDPRYYISHKHLVPDSRDWQAARAEATEIPGQLDLKLTLSPQELSIPSGETGEAGTAIDLSGCPASEATFVIGKKVDMERECNLQIGSAPEQPWTSYSDIIVCALGLTPIGKGTTIGLGILNGFFHLFKGEPKAALITWASIPANAAINISLTTTSVKTVLDRFSVPSLILDRSDDTLRNLGYTSLEKIPPVADWPLWVNLNEEKLALMDSAGILHQVYWPGNLRIPLPYFTIQSFLEIDAGKPAIYPPWYKYAQLDSSCKPLEWTAVETGMEIRVIPYPDRFRPIRVIMEQRDEPTIRGAKEGLRIHTDEGGRMELDWGTIDFGYSDTPPSRLGPYPIHPGMEYEVIEPDLKVYKEHYIAVWEGNLKVIDEDREIGIYAGGTLSDIPCKPAAWCRGRGTEYDIEVTAGNSFRVDVIEGQVDIIDRNMSTIETLDAGGIGEYDLAELASNEPPEANLAVAPENPVPGDIVLVTSLSTDPDGDPLTFSWYVDGNYYAGASTAEGIVLEEMEAGEHTVKLVVEDGMGGQDEYSAEFAIGDEGFDSRTLLWIAGGVIVVLLVFGGLRNKNRKQG